MSVQKASSNQHPTPTDHAKERWRQRTSTKVAIRVAWERGIVVSNEHDCEVARLYPPEDVVFLARDGVIVTVVPANYDTLGTEGLACCNACGSLFEWSVDASCCPWCGDATTTMRSSTNITITHER